MLFLLFQPFFNLQPYIQLFSTSISIIPFKLVPNLLPLNTFLLISLLSSPSLSSFLSFSHYQLLLFHNSSSANLQKSFKFSKLSALKGRLCPLRLLILLKIIQLQGFQHLFLLPLKLLAFISAVLAVQLSAFTPAFLAGNAIFQLIFFHFQQPFLVICTLCISTNYFRNYLIMKFAVCTLTCLGSKVIKSFNF